MSDVSQEFESVKTEEEKNELLHQAAVSLPRICHISECPETLHFTVLTSVQDVGVTEYQTASKKGYVCVSDARDKGTHNPNGLFEIILRNIPRPTTVSIKSPNHRLLGKQFLHSLISLD